MDVLDQSVPAREDRNRIHCFGVIDEIKITLIEEGNERIKLYVKRRSRTDVTAKSVGTWRSSKETLLHCCLHS